MKSQRSTEAWKAVIFALVALFALSGAAPIMAQDGDDVDAADESEAGEDKSSNPLADIDHSDVVVDPSLWILDLEIKKIRTITMLEGPFKGQVFWYLLYNVENKGDEDRATHLSITAKSDRKKSYVDTYVGSVERAVERKVGRPLWGRADLVKAQKDRDPKGDGAKTFNYTTFESGKKRQCVAIFNKLDPGANKIVISFRGLSNDFHLITNEDGSREIEERVYQLRYERPADEYEINLDRFHLRKKEWVKKRVKLTIPESAE